MLSTDFDDEGNDEESERIFDVIHYVVEAGERPPVSGWVGKLWQPGRGRSAAGRVRMIQGRDNRALELTSP
ncbi:hypothetical protein ACFVRU_19240 [Streptomyces sp. NPDC057927]